MAQRYLEMLCREAAKPGVPRDRLFAHGAGWKEGELIYDVPVNSYACPGWSFYKHAADPRKDTGRAAQPRAKSDAPYWAATEWLLQGTAGRGRVARGPGQHAGRPALPLRLHLQLGKHPRQRVGPARHHRARRRQCRTQRANRDARTTNTMKRLLLGIAVFWGWLSLAAGSDAEELARGFQNPPPSARPWVYWFWLDGNITKEGITADLEAMQRVGLGGALWMWGGGVGEGVKGPVKFLSPQWWELMRHTVQEADRLGLKINLTAGSGWSHSGGPWIKPEHSMRRLELSQEIRLTGPGLKDVAIPGGDALVAVLAYPLNGGHGRHAQGRGEGHCPAPLPRVFPWPTRSTRIRPRAGFPRARRPATARRRLHPQWLVFEFPNPFAAAALYIAPFHDCGPRQCQWQVSKDGKEYQTVCRFELAPNTPRTIPFEAPASRFFRLLITSAHPFQGQESWNVQIAEIQLLQQGEQPLKKEPLDSRAVVDLTAKLDSSGHLSWDVPPGTWTVQVFRHRSTGDQPHPILPDEGGLECDKLSPEAVEAHWNGYIRRVLDECGPAARRVIRWVHADSYEFGPQTWTPKFREEFKRRCGYDPVPYLPAIVGKVVDGTSISERFLWDFRRVRADLFAEGIGGHLRELCRREGMALTTEPHLVPEVFDQIQYGGYVSEPVGNFLGERRTAWYAQNPPVGPEVHLAKGEASAAYTYGLNGVVWAEAFTGVDHAHAWKETPEYLKTWGDLWLTEGINRFAFHCWAHSPSLTRKPGITLGPWGIHFDRRNTWFDLATGYLSYLSRCQFMLQQGLPVMDVCMLTGDGVVAEFPEAPGTARGRLRLSRAHRRRAPASHCGKRPNRFAFGHALSAPGHLQSRTAPRDHPQAAGPGQSRRHRPRGETGRGSGVGRIPSQPRGGQENRGGTLGLRRRGGPEGARVWTGQSVPGAFRRNRSRAPAVAAWRLTFSAPVNCRCSGIWEWRRISNTRCPARKTATTCWPTSTAACRAWIGISCPTKRGGPGRRPAPSESSAVNPSFGTP